MIFLLKNQFLLRKAKTIMTVSHNHTEFIIIVPFQIIIFKYGKKFIDFKFFFLIQNVRKSEFNSAMGYTFPKEKEKQIYMI